MTTMVVGEMWSSCDGITKFEECCLILVTKDIEICKEYVPMKANC